MHDACAPTFHDALMLGDKHAADPIAFIRELYRIEGEANEHQLDAAGGFALRTEQSQPWLAKLELWVDTNMPKLMPSSRLAEACSYARQQRPFIQRCFSDGRFEIDNGES